MSQGQRRAFTLLIVGLLLAAAAPARAARTQRKVSAPADLLRDFAALAQNRPRACAGAAEAARPPAGWTLERDECAWQNLLHVRRWSAADVARPGACVSAPAQWWAWSEPGAKSQAWRAAWTGQARQDDSGAVKRIVVLQRAAGGQWSATEWRWTPSARAATRAWQQGRWNLLAALAAKSRQPATAATGQAQGLQAAWEQNLGGRAGEITGEAWRWAGGGVCLRAAPAAPGQQQFRLPYAAEDGRHEQRAAMQLQLARRYPGAVWLTPFRLLPAAPQARGGAKYEAVWSEGAQVHGQLWIPSRGEGPVLRLRVSATAAGAPAAAQTAQAIERELAGIADRWSELHE